MITPRSGVRHGTRGTGGRFSACWLGMGADSIFLRDEDGVSMGDEQGGSSAAVALVPVSGGLSQGSAAPR